jgi:phage terminase large subunit-like protein
MEAWNKCLDPTLTPESMKDVPCWLGTDLALMIDLCARVRLHRRDIDGKAHYYAFAQTYLPEARVNLPENQHYQKWAKQGYLTATSGNAVDRETLLTDALADINGSQVREYCFDPAHATEHAQRVNNACGITTVEVAQNTMGISPAMKEVEEAVYDGRFHHDGNPVLTFCISNVQSSETRYGNYSMPTKSRPESKIDAAMALFIAMSRAMLAPPPPPKRYTGLRSV